MCIFVVFCAVAHPLPPPLLSGHRPILPPCLGDGSEASWGFDGVSWDVIRRQLGYHVYYFWESLWDFLGPRWAWRRQK
eukprot:9183745-Pyramimonas_sp.AAC.1